MRAVGRVVQSEASKAASATSSALAASSHWYSSRSTSCTGSDVGRKLDAGVAYSSSSHLLHVVDMMQAGRRG